MSLEDVRYFISTGKKSNKIFVIPNSDTMLETEIMKLANEWMAPEYEVDIVPVVQPTLLSGVKFSDADYLTVLDKEYINIYWGKRPKSSSHKRQFSVGTSQNKDYGAFH